MQHTASVQKASLSTRTHTNTNTNTHTHTHKNTNTNTNTNTTRAHTHIYHRGTNMRTSTSAHAACTRTRMRARPPPPHTHTHTKIWIFFCESFRAHRFVQIAPIRVANPRAMCQGPINGGVSNGGGVPDLDLICSGMVRGFSRFVPFLFLGLLRLINLKSTYGGSARSISCFYEVSATC